MTATIQAPVAPPPDPDMARSAPRLRRSLLPIALYAILAILIVLPVALVVLSAFTTTTPRPGNIDLSSLTFDNFAAVFGPGARQAALNSLLIGIGASVLALAIGGFLAFVSARTNVRGARFLYFVGLVPMFLPSYVGALAWSLLGGPNAGLLNVFARDLNLPDVVDIYNIGGLIFVLALYYAPYAFLLTHSAFSLMNPDLEEAARTHGAKPLTVLRTVTVPLATPALLGSAILIFVLTVENFPVAQITSGGRLDTLPTYIFRLMNSAPARGNEAAAVAITLVVIVLAVTALQRRVVARRSFTTVAGKGMKLGKFDLGRFRTPALVIGIGYFTLSTVLPLLALAFVALHESPYVNSVIGAFTNGRMGLDAVTEAITSDVVIKATGNSVVVAVAAAVVGTVLAFIVSYVVNRTTLPGREGLGYLSMLPLAVPAIVLGLGLLWTWLMLPVPVYGTLLVMVIAFVAAQMPQGYQGASSSILQIHRDLEDSAVMHGANRPRAVWRVTAPLLRVPLTSTFLLLLMLSMRELTVPLFLFTTDTRLLSIVIFDDFENGIMQRSAATSLVYCVVIFALAYLARRFGADTKQSH
ncbi:iron ABC transporter permease [Mycolicibacterium wolinskyi]|uniref:Iron ABC transporter permease n=1 Tax=Mycolicibacterium wolinskyi TaxID=59750 RepID=A0A132PNC1_9MYCO|nr:iron ABC transporter permease [Mycolicibacterium wolinskyi]KWX23836.1 iron ABC transporter permease [Mycolicibacterium wolinskyi]